MEFLHSDDRDYDSIRMDPVVDFDLNSVSSDEDENKGNLVANDTAHPSQHDEEKDFELHTLIPNRDIEIHAAQTPTPSHEDILVTQNTKYVIPSSSLATMESLEYFKAEGTLNFY